MLKPRDIFVLLKVKISKNRWTYQELAESLGISSSEVHGSLKNCDESGLYVSRSRRVLNSAFHEFLVHGLKYSFPAKPGALVLGIPTAHSAEPLKGIIMANEDNAYVWSSGNGQGAVPRMNSGACTRRQIRGQAIEPLHKCVPQAVQKDPELYQLLSLVDGLRVGRAREQDFAAQELGRIMAR